MNRSSSVRSSFRRLRCFTALVVLSAAVSTTPQASATTTPREASVQAGFSVDRLARLEKSMNDWVQRGWIPGCVALVIRDGHVAFFRAAGYDDVEARKPLQTDAIFRIASQTKAVTSVAIMMLMEDGCSSMIRSPSTSRRIASNRYSLRSTRPMVPPPPCRRNATSRSAIC